jgi:hypothetical protein
MGVVSEHLRQVVSEGRERRRLFIDLSTSFQNIPGKSSEGKTGKSGVGRMIIDFWI